MELEGKKIVVVGMGKTGLSCVRFLGSRGASVIANDGGENPEPWADEVRALGGSPVWGGHPPELFAEADLVVVSPGVPHTLEPLRAVLARNVPVIGEIELASRFVDAPILAITGTNGKTTTTTLLGEMLKRSGFRVFVGGNIGVPLIDYVSGTMRADRVVVEVSSFQLDTIVSFSPSVAVLLNITEDHMDRYPDFDAYVRSKGRIFENQGKADSAVINGADPHCLSAADEITSRKWLFNATGRSRRGAVLTENRLEVDCEDQRVSFDLSETPLQGTHNRENIAAATLAALATGAIPESIQRALNDFKGLPHRLSYVDTIRGVRFFDDSKGTNVDAVVRALEAFHQPVILIMGGRGKGGGYGPLKDPVRRRVKKLIVLGETREAIRSELGPECSGGVETAGTMEEAVLRAAASAEAGDVVLLSPSGSSFDMFTSYSHRGECFCRAVREWKRQGEDAAVSAGI